MIAMEEKKYKDYGTFIRERRRELGISQAELSQSLGCSNQAVSKYENNQAKIYLALLDPLCKTLKLDIESFILKRKAMNTTLSLDHDFSTATFVRSLAFLREKKHITQKALADDLHISSQKITKWEGGHSLPTIEEFVTLAQYYNIPLEKLYYSVFDTTPPQEAPLESSISTETPLPVQTPEKKKTKKPWLIAVVASIASIGITLSISLPLVFNYYHSNGLTTQATCQVTFDFGDVQDPITMSVAKNSAMSEPNFSITGYNVIGFRYNDATFDFTTLITNDITINVLTEKKTYTVTFYDYYNNIISIQSIKYLEDALPPLETKLKSVKGYHFLKWDKSFRSVSEDLAIKAIYSKDYTQIQLVLEDDESLPSNDNRTTYYDFTTELIYQLPTPIKEGYNFEGWYFNGEPFTSDTPLVDTMILRAEFTQQKTYTISFDTSNNPEYELSSIEVNYGDTIQSLPVEYKNETYISGYSYQNNENETIELTLPFTYTLDRDITLTAKVSSTNLRYEFVENSTRNIRITGIIGDVKTVTIPETVDGYAVKEIGSNILSSENTVEEIVINARLDKVGSNAFSNSTTLKKITFEKVDYYTTFGENILSGCEKISYLKTGNVSKGTYTYSDYGIASTADVLLEFNELTTKLPDGYVDTVDSTISSLILPSSLLKLDDNVFTNAENLQSVIFQEGIQSLNLSNFANLNTNELNFPESLTTFTGNLNCNHVDRVIFKAESVYLNGTISNIEAFDMSKVKYLYLGENISTFVTFSRLAMIPSNIQAADSSSTFLEVVDSTSIEAYIYDTKEAILPDSFTTDFTWLSGIQNVSVTLHYMLA